MQFQWSSDFTKSQNAEVGRTSGFTWSNQDKWEHSEQVGHDHIQATVEDLQEGDSTTSMGNVYKCSILKQGKKCFLMLRQNPLCFSLCLLPFILALGTSEKLTLSPLQLSTVWFYLLYGRQKFSKEFASDLFFFFPFFFLFYFKHRPTAWWKVNCYIIKNLDGLKKKKKKKKKIQTLPVQDVNSQRLVINVFPRQTIL